MRNVRNRLWISVLPCALVVCATAMVGRDVSAQRGAGPAAPARTAKELAPNDLTGTWVSIISEDWRWRMVTPPGPIAPASGRGAPVVDVASIPVNPEGRKVAASWNLAADNAAGNQCKAFGVGAITRLPGRIRISWQDDQALKLEYDTGTQTRLLRFGPAAPPSGAKTWQGYSTAVWEGPGVGRGGPPAGRGAPARPAATGGGVAITGAPGGGGAGLRGGPPPRQAAQINTGGYVKVATTNFREGYLRKNGVPYSEQAAMTEYIQRLPTHPNGDNWLHVLTIVEDPRYLTQPFYTSSHFRLEPNDAAFKPTPCATSPPLPQNTSR